MLAAIEAHTWRGNVRELRNALERAAALAIPNIIDVKSVLPRTAVATDSGTTHTASTDTRASADEVSAVLTLDELEREHIVRVLAAAHNNRDRAAAILGISARTLYRKLREYGDEA